MITLEQVIKYLAHTYSDNTTVELLVGAPFCCEGFIDALYNENILRISNGDYRLPADYADEFNITFCPFCGLRISELKATDVD